MHAMSGSCHPDGNTNCACMTAKVSSGSIKNLSIGQESVFGTVAHPTSLHKHMRIRMLCNMHHEVLLSDDQHTSRNHWHRAVSHHHFFESLAHVLLSNESPHTEVGPVGTKVLCCEYTLRLVQTQTTVTHATCLHSIPCKLALL